MPPTEALEEEIQENEEAEDGASNEADPQNNDDGHVEGEDKAADEGREEGEVSGDDREGQAEPEPEPDWKARYESLESEVKQLKEASAKTAPAPAQAAQPRVYTEEEKAKIEEAAGVPFKSVEFMGNLIGNTVNSMRGYVDSRLSKFEKDTAIGALAQEKEFADVGSYRQGMDEFLNKLPVTAHGNREALVDAYYYAKGKGLKKTMNKIQSKTEKNRKIAGSARPASSSSSRPQGQRPKSYKLNPQEEGAWESFAKHHFDSKEDYARSLTRYKDQ